MDGWFNKLLCRVVGTIVAIVILAWLIRVAYDFVAPAIPLILASVGLGLIVLFVIRRRSGW